MEQKQEIKLYDKNSEYILCLSGGSCKNQNMLLNNICHALNRSIELGIIIEKLERIGGDCVHELQQVPCD